MELKKRKKNFYVFFYKTWELGRTGNFFAKLSNPVLSCPVLSFPDLTCRVLSCPVLSSPVLSCSFLQSCQTLSIFPILSSPCRCLWTVFAVLFTYILQFIMTNLKNVTFASIKWNWWLWSCWLVIIIFSTYYLLDYVLVYLMIHGFQEENIGMYLQKLQWCK